MTSFNDNFFYDIFYDSDSLWQSMAVCGSLCQSVTVGGSLLHNVTVCGSFKFYKLIISISLSAAGAKADRALPTILS